MERSTCGHFEHELPTKSFRYTPLYDIQATRCRCDTVCIQLLERRMWRAKLIVVSDPLIGTKRQFTGERQNDDRYPNDDPYHAEKVIRANLHDLSP